MRHRIDSKLLFLVAAVLALVGCLNQEQTPTAVPVETIPAAGEQSGEEPGGEQPGREPVEPAPPPAALATAPLGELFPIAAPASSNIASGTAVKHIVTQGEWLLLIARCYGAAYSAVRQANPAVVNPNFIMPGATIAVPNAGSAGSVIGPPCVQQYTAQPGDTWQIIAQRFATDAAMLQRANPGALAAGRKIFVPVAAPPNPLPTFSHNLLFIKDGNLVVWQGSHGLADKVANSAVFIFSLATNAMGQWLLVEQTRDANASTEIALVDRTSNTMTTLETGLGANQPSRLIAGREMMLISPDGQWGAYVLPEGGTYRLTTFPINNPAAKKSVSGIQHGVSSGDGILPELFPSKDAAHFLLLDNGGIFEYEYALTAVERIIYPIEQTEGAIFSQPRAFDALAWSPQGRYLLLNGFMFEGSQDYVLDGETNQLAVLPDSGAYVIRSGVTWRQDGTAVVLSPPADGAAGPKMAVYQPTPAGGSLALNLVKQETLTLPAASVPVGPGYSLVPPHVQPVADRLIFALATGTAGAEANGVWLVKEGSTQAERLNKIPDNGFVFIWAPLASGVIVASPDQADKAKDVFYVPLEGLSSDQGGAFAINQWLGFALSDFHWFSP